MLDVDQFTLRLPTFEYSDQTWSWLDFTLQLRRDAIKVIFGGWKTFLTLFTG